MRSAAQVRQEFIDFFRGKGHAFVPSSPVVPLDDPTLLFTNAGMNQFKPYFLGTETPRHRRVANTQKCIRAGGKHNDLDDVGHDTYHHTFFEMLGNWSFGDYFKKEAIEWAWELLTKVWGIDKSRLYATYFGGTDAGCDGGAGCHGDALRRHATSLPADLEARDLWLKVTDIDPSHVHAGSAKDNFWEMGETGPCGPCSEIHFDLTPDKSGGKLVNAGDSRVIEIWNLVFIQFNRGPDGQLTPLPARHVDTGMGFERVTAVLQGHNNNYATDVFVPVIEHIERLTEHVYGGSAGVSPATGDEGGEARMHGDVAARLGPARANPPPSQGGAGGGSKLAPSESLNPPVVPPRRGDGAERPGGRFAIFRPGNMQDEACRVIADHVRCLTFALTDGGVPDREGRGYVLRRILRRAVRFGWQYLGLHKPFLCELVDTVVDTMGDAFPELKKSPQHVKEVIREEEESFERTLDRGIAMFEEAAETARRHHHNEIRGDDAFRLHDTYGFPIDLTQVMAQEKGLTVDIAEYERLMEEARERARRTRTLVGATYSPAQTSSATVVVRPAATDDSAKYSDQEIKAKLRAIARPDEQGRFDVVSRPDVARVAEQVGLIFDRTCFYAEAGGQVGDVGSVTAANARFDVEQTRTCGEHVIHWGVVVIGEFRTGETYELAVDRRRAATMKNHTATHVMNWALREVLGDHVQQKGSLVDHEKTRFDFSHPRPLTPGEIERVEQLVKERIRANLPVYYKVVPQQDALKINGLRAVFGERYPDEVRVMSIGVPVEDLIRNPDNAEWRKYSIEFCGGTHLSNTADIERFVVASEEAVAKGIRRIVGLSGSAADLAVELGDALLKRAERLRAGPAEQVAGGLSELQNTLATAVIPVRHRLRLRGLIDELQSIVRQQQKSDAADATRAVKAHVAVLLEQAQKIGDTTVVIGELPDLSVDQLKTGADMIKQKCGSAAVLLGVRVLPQEDNQSRDRQGGSAGVSPANTRPGPASKALLLAAMTPDLVKKGLKAGDLVKAIAPIIGGAGGGPPTMAQAGGRALDKLADALAAGRKWLTDRL